MSDSGPTRRLRRIERRIPGFPCDPMRLVRMAYHLQKTLRNKTNSVLKKYDLADTSYMVLAILYGSGDETPHPNRVRPATRSQPIGPACVMSCSKRPDRGGPKPGDRRAVMMSRSERGRALIEPAVPDVSGTFSKAFGDFTPAELQPLASLYQRVLANLDRPAR